MKIKGFYIFQWIIFCLKKNAKMNKIEQTFIINQYRSGVKSYEGFTKNVGLWDSESFVFKKYLRKNHQILDLGCGTGRTTFPLYQLGFTNIIGVDLTPEMIVAAKKMNQLFQTSIDFQVGDATALNFDNDTFDSIIFSFNGIMSIPNQRNRDKALEEIHRVVKPKGIFIFTTHDRNEEAMYFDFWKAEKQRWEQGEQNTELYEYGDLITESKNESRQIFIHIPTKTEIQEWLAKYDFEVLETFYRSEKFTENEAIKAKSGECRFWIARKL